MRAHGVNLVATVLGDGRVDTETALEDLLGKDVPRSPSIPAPSVPYAKNFRLTEGIAKPRSGYAAFAGAAAAANPITGLITARFDNNSNEILRCDYNSVRRYLSGAWDTPLSFDVALRNTVTGLANYWRSAMVRRAASSIGNQLLIANGADEDPMYRYTGGGATLLATGADYIRGPRVILGNRGRIIAANVYDMASTMRRYQRVWLSIVGVGEPPDFVGSGSGFFDLDDDAYPIIGGLTVGSNVALMKGNAVGGSIVVGTLTGLTASPYRWDTQNTSGIGLLLPRTLIQITPDVAFFFGHDNMYLYDGARGLFPIGQEIVKGLLKRINYSALDASFAFYRARTREIVVGLAVDGAAVPNEFWVIDLPTRRPYGPHVYAHSLLGATDYSLTGIKRFGDFPAGETFGNTPDVTWGSITGEIATGGFIYGASTGAAYLDDGAATTDAGTAIELEYRIGAITPFGYVLVHPKGNQRVTLHDDYYELKDFALVYRNKGVWTPTVQVATALDGSGNPTWQTISDGSTAGNASNIDRMMTKNYSYEASGQWFLFRITGSDGYLQALRMEFTYAGSGRNE